MIRASITVSIAKLVMIPLTMARLMINQTGQGTASSWHTQMVPKSPSAQPKRQPAVLRQAKRNTCQRELPTGSVLETLIPTI